MPKLEVVIEHIVHQERETKERNETSSTTETAMTSRKQYKGRPKPKCYYCGKIGHIERYCRAKKEGQKERKDSQSHCLSQKTTPTVIAPHL